MMSNKDLLDKLTEYLLTQDVKVICRALANAMLDQHRIHNLIRLDPGTKIHLFKRIKLNAESLDDFYKNGPKGNFSCGPVKGDET